MPPSKIPVAAVQCGAHDREDFASSWPRIVALAHTAGERGARLIVLPEGTVPGYVLGPEAVRADELARAANDVAALAVRHGAVVVYGGAKIEGDLVYNAAICVGPDGVELGHAAKQFLWHFDRRWFARGETLRPVDTPLGRLGLLVCADGRIPTIAATLVERGAQILVMPTAWVTSGRDPEALENIQADLMANVRARENGVPFVVANKCGVERESVAYCGKSAVIDARGAFVARAGETTAEVAFGEVELARSATPSRRERLEPAETAAASSEPRARARVAFTPADTRAGVDRLAALAAFADCDLLVARGPRGQHLTTTPPLAIVASAEAPVVDERAGLRYAVVRDATMHDPRGLVELRLAGVDLFVWESGDDDWCVRFARTRAAELRAYVVVFTAGGVRSFAVDPDGAVVAGTFGDFRMASFVYDRARAQATTVAPTTDVFAGLRLAEAIRAGDALRAGASEGNAR